MYEIYFHPSMHIWKTKASLLSVVVVLELNFFVCLFRNCFSMISIFMAGSTRKRSRFKKTLWNQQSKISLMLLDYIILLYFLDEYTFFFSLLTLRNYRLSSLFHHSRPVVGNSQTDYFFNTFFYFYIWFLMFFLRVFISDRRSWINMLHSTHFLNWLMPLHSDNVMKDSPSP